MVKLLEALKEETNKSLKERQGNTINQVKELNKTKNRNRNRNNKENTKGGNPGDGQLRKVIRSYRCKHHQQNSRDRRENIRCRRYHRKY